MDVSSAVRAFTAHDWAEELQQRATREAAREEWCDPGIGYFEGDRILHICPVDGNRGYVHYHFTEERRFFGFLPRRVQASRSNMDVALSELPEFIRRFYENDHDWLLRNTR